MEKRIVLLLIAFTVAAVLMACSTTETVPTIASSSTETAAPSETASVDETQMETVQSETTNSEPSAPLQDEISKMRAVVLEGMSEDDRKGLCATIKRANKELEYSKIYDNLFARLSDENSLLWNCFEQTGEIQTGWGYDGELSITDVMEEENITEDEFYEKYAMPVLKYNKQDAEGFAQELEGYQKAVVNQALQSDLQQIIDFVRLAAQTHNVDHVVNIYHLLHDMDYFLLNYRMDKELPYIRDTSTISKYYGVLNVYAEQQ